MEEDQGQASGDKEHQELLIGLPPQLSNGTMEKIDVEAIARLCHNVNAAYCFSIGDRSQCEWENAPQWQKDSAIAGVQFHIANHCADPSGSHESWLKTNRQIMEYGPVKDIEKRRTKDYLFAAIVWTMTNTPA